MSRLHKLALIVPFGVFFLTSVGQGFVADDFGWILDSRVARLADVPSRFQRSTGFYRPVVGLTFAADYLALRFQTGAMTPWL
jgi:hypothetical protein